MSQKRDRPNTRKHKNGTSRGRVTGATVPMEMDDPTKAPVKLSTPLSSPHPRASKVTDQSVRSHKANEFVFGCVWSGNHERLGPPHPPDIHDVGPGGAPGSDGIRVQAEPRFTSYPRDATPWRSYFGDAMQRCSYSRHAAIWWIP